MSTTLVIKTTCTLEHYKALMARFNIPVSNAGTDGAPGYLDNLQRLLAGETAEFHYQTYDSATQQLVDDPEKGFAVSLKWD